MKRNLGTAGRVGGMLRLAALQAALLLAAGTATTTQAQPASPVGTWDFVISGAEKGVAFITFSNDYSFEGVEIIVPVNKNNDDPDPRYPVSDGRTGSVDTNAPAPSTETTMLYGGYDFTGHWTFDLKGQVIGSYGEIAERIDGGTTNSFTNSVSFTAKVTPGKRMSMKGFSGVGKINFRGVPYSPSNIPDISGDWYADVSRDGQKFYEFFNASAWPPFAFAINGNSPMGGPGYTFAGAALVSSQKYIALNTGLTSSSNTVARSLSGSFNPKKLTGSLKGSEDPGLWVKMKLGPTAP